MIKFNNLKNVIAVFLTMAVTLGTGAVFVSAEAKNDIKTYEYSALSGIDTVVSGGSVVINGEENELYRVFSNPSNAITDIKTTVPSLLETISVVYDLSELSETNWEEYRDAMLALLDSDNKPTGYSESSDDFLALSSFFDIYENKEKNEEITELVSSTTFSRSSDALNDLALLLP